MMRDASIPGVRFVKILAVGVLFVYLGSCTSVTDPIGGIDVTTDRNVYQAPATVTLTVTNIEDDRPVFVNACDAAVQPQAQILTAAVEWDDIFVPDLACPSEADTDPIRLEPGESVSRQILFDFPGTFRLGVEFRFEPGEAVERRKFTSPFDVVN